MKYILIIITNETMYDELSSRTISTIEFLEIRSKFTDRYTFRIELRQWLSHKSFRKDEADKRAVASIIKGYEYYLANR